MIMVCNMTGKLINMAPSQYYYIFMFDIYHTLPIENVVHLLFPHFEMTFAHVCYKHCRIVLCLNEMKK